MSRSFLIHADTTGKNITVQQIFENMQKLKYFNKTGININDIEVFRHEKLISFRLENFVYVSINDNSISIESRALDGKGRHLFIAVASVMSIIFDSPVDSGDGAWNNCEKYSGDELWNEHINLFSF